MILHVRRAEYLGGHRVHLWFNDGTDGEVDLAGVLSGPVFQPLLDPTHFQCFRIEGHTLSWENGADFAPEYLQSLVREETVAYVRPDKWNEHFNG
jgi:hypothetical protein